MSKREFAKYPYHVDSYKKHRITDEELDFLQELQKEMNTQHTWDQADPRIWVIQEPEIKNWIKKDVEAYIELSISSELITGEGIAFHTDWKNIFSVHSVVVVLHRDRNNLFYVKTAYPIAGFDDVDDILDAMEEYDS